VDYWVFSRMLYVSSLCVQQVSASDMYMECERYTHMCYIRNWSEVQRVHQPDGFIVSE